jgi:hypothetical protein
VAILPHSCAIVCHDAGAANIVFAWVAAERPAAARVHASGPAAGIAAYAGGSVDCSSVNEALDGASMLVSGTGWASDVEHDARRLARSRGLRSVAVIDHWVNYRERFERGGELVLPDEIWITDDEAGSIARECFPSLPVVLQRNLYTEQMLAEIERAGPADPGEILYLLEPLRTDFGRGRPGEFQALDFFAEQLPQIGLRSPPRIRLRPHPSDAPGKYDDWMEVHRDLAVEYSAASEPLAAAIGSAGIVAGCHTYAMSVALQAGRRVICTLPPWSPPCVLPFAGIEQLARR